MSISATPSVASLLVHHAKRALASSAMRDAVLNSSSSSPDVRAAGIATSSFQQSKKGRLKAPLPRASEGSRRRLERKSAARGSDEAVRGDDRGVPGSTSAATSAAASASTSASTSASARPHQLKADLVERYLGLATPSEQKQMALQAVIREFARFPGDTGSSEVQVALLTNKISFLAEHLKLHRKDYSSKRGLMAMLNQRRQTLQYLRRSDFERYEFCLAKLGLKDIGKTYDRLSARYSD
jgi:small subunit ribosomal protein S15